MGDVVVLKGNDVYQLNGIHMIPLGSVGVIVEVEEVGDSYSHTFEFVLAVVFDNPSLHYMKKNARAFEEERIHWYTNEKEVQPCA